MIEYIRENISWAELLAQLAEEATELAHAALKMRRTCSDENPTPVSFDEAYDNLMEEIGDVLLCLQTMNFPTEPAHYQQAMDAKLERWVRRLKGDCGEG